MILHTLEDEGTDQQIRPDLPADSCGVTVFVVDGGRIGNSEGTVYVNNNANCDGLRRRLPHLTSPRKMSIDGLVLSASKNGERGIFGCRGDIIPPEYENPYVCGVLYGREHLAVTRSYQQNPGKYTQVQEAAARL